MWISEREWRRAEQARAAALAGEVTLAGDPAGVYLDGERRALPVFGPGGYVWRPAVGQRVLALKAGERGEAPCVAGAECGAQWDLEPGEVLIHSGEAAIRLKADGTVAVTGALTVNGKSVMTAV